MKKEKKSKKAAPKPFPIDDELPPGLLEEYTDDRNIYELIRLVRKGLGYNTFAKIEAGASFSSSDWSKFLHLSERTMQRYKRERSRFSALHAEKILQIVLLHNTGSKIFGNPERFEKWLYADNIALGGIRPKELLDSSFGIRMVRDELTRIEHGVLA